MEIVRMNSPTDDFRQAMLAAGLEPPDHINADGELHRFGMNGDTGTPCWYSLHIDDNPAGAFGCHKRDINEGWSYRNPSELTPAERQQLRERAEASRQQAAAERREKQAQAAQKAEKFWRESSPADPDHPYLKRKGIAPHGARQIHDSLQVPLFDADGKLTNLQRINSDGTKRYLPDAAKRSHFCPLGKIRPDGRVLIAEGFATAASVHESTGETAIVAFDCGNLRPVAEALRNKYPDLKIDFVADNDHLTDGNPGIRHAVKTARAVGGAIYFPVFPEGASGSDFNDLARLTESGPDLDAVRQQLEHPRTETEISFLLNRTGGNGGLADSQQSRGLEAADEVADEWRTSPEPLAERPRTPEFPADALGQLLGSAAQKIAYFVQAPLAMCGAAALAAAALSVQQYINVRRGGVGTGPVSLYVLTVSGSGDRKTSVDKLALRGVREVEGERIEAHKQEQSDYRAQLTAWQTRRDSIAATDKGKVLSQDAQTKLEEKLEAHEAERPEPPQRPNFTFSEPTAEGIYRHFENGHPSAGLFSDEGIGFFGGHGMMPESRGRMLATLSSCWDGSPFTRTRSTEGQSGILANRRLSCHLMCQPVVAAQVLADPVMVGQGFLPRFLITRADSLAGSRFIQPRPIDENPEHDPDLQKFWSRQKALISGKPEVDDNGGLKLKTLEIRGEALTTWRALHDGIEAEMGEDGAYRDIRPFASKAAENAARIAAVLAYFEHDPESRHDPEITTAHVERAGKLIAYFLALISAREQEAEQDAQEIACTDLLTWIRNHGGELASVDFKKLPRGFRMARQCRPLLGILVERGYLKISQYSDNDHPQKWQVIENA
ncbi:DUF3987 domain-containing protein [Microbulbifer sp. HZ11]|uniref:DUF3987 domain-containing protein n=1 Tax=Microbulbifer sp. HZ11 TaxID=1453501 RepID=UPI0018CC142A|nr:DUF3987 domain-containing protein [Microbulbifer sp. HZ11]